MAVPKVAPFYGNAPFILEAGDLTSAIASGLLRPNVFVQQTDQNLENYGVAYSRKDNIGIETHGSQKAIQTRCKEFAKSRGFQLKVAGFSSKHGGGNAKYVCKKLNGQQFFDKEDDQGAIGCPFFFNVSGVAGEWKVIRANFCHNHLKNFGFSERPVAEGTIARPDKDLRNTTQQVDEIIRLVRSEMLNKYEGKMDRMTGAAIAKFLLGKGISTGRSSISRIKLTLDELNHGDRLTNYQKLESYLKLMAEKNAGSVWKFEKNFDGTFQRACFIPSIGIRVARAGRRLFGVDGAHLKGEMNNYGVYLVATVKDYDNHILPFAFSLVPTENYDHWVWFLSAVKEALGDHDRFTIVSDRQKGLLSAVETVFPNAGHRFCLRHIKSNISSKGISLTGVERGIINKMARSDCEADYTLFEKEFALTKPAAVTYLKGIDKAHWVKYQYQERFNLPTYNETTSNLAEQTNNWIGNECRSAKPLDAFWIYFRQLNELVSRRRQVVVTWLRAALDTDPVPLLATELQKLSEASQQCEITPCMEGAYNVMFNGPTDNPGYIHPWRQVNLPAKECTCGNWQDKEFPCDHAVAAEVCEGQALDTLFDSTRMSIAQFRLSYHVPFQPWPTTVTLASDLSVRMPCIQSDPPELGKRGLKPGPKPKHKRKKAKGGD